MGELLLLILVAGSVALAVAWPLLGPAADVPEPEPDPELEAAFVRHRLALEALRDIEADHRAGSLDEGAYQAQREEGEDHAARTLRALEAVGQGKRPRRTTVSSRDERVAVAGGYLRGGRRRGPAAARRIRRPAALRHRRARRAHRAHPAAH